MITLFQPVITGYCFTNLDEYRRVKWPSQFVAVPRVDECVESIEDSFPMRSLKVVRVTHAINSTGPYIRVELHR